MSLLKLFPVSIFITACLFGDTVVYDSTKESHTLRTPSVWVDEFEKLRDTQKYVVIDVREPNEFFVQHLVPAINLPLGQVAEKISAVVSGAAKSSTKIYIYCRSGNRATSAVETLNGLGYDSYLLANGALATIISLTGWPSIIGDLKTITTTTNTQTTSASSSTASCTPNASYLLSRPVGKWSLVGTSVDMDSDYISTLRANTKKAFVWNDERQEWSDMNTDGFTIKANQGFWVVR